MVDYNGRIQDVPLADVEQRISEGWFMVATDADVMSEPLPTPKMDMDLLSNPRRDAADAGGDE